MNLIKRNRVFQIAYPLLVYFTIYQLGVSLLIDLYGDKIGKLSCLCIAGIACFIPLFVIYRNIPKLIPEDNIDSKRILQYAIWVISVIAIGVALNVILTHSGIINHSDNFAKASNTLTDGTFYIKILCNVIVVPLVEELLIRGIIAGQLCLWHGPVVAVVFSSICFGIMHNNIVQFIYAVVVGLAIGTMYVKTKRLSLCVIAHGCINLITILFSYFS